MAENRLLSVDEKVSIILLCGKYPLLTVAEMFNAKYPARNISNKTVSRILNKFKETGSVNNQMDKCGRRPSATGDDVATAVLGQLINSPKKSIRKLSQQTGVSRTSIQRILKTHKFHPYKVQLTQSLHEDDFDRRLEFCEWFLQHGFVKSIIFSDEAVFYLSGHVNRHNCRYWSDSNPHWISDTNEQSTPRIMVWAAICDDHVIGPFFFNEHVNKDTYLAMLQDYLTPILDDIPLASRMNLWFQQDGAPPHFGLNVRQFLDDQFGNQWIGRRGAVEWPPRSPDLSPLDYFLWGHLKSCVYTNRPRTIETLKENITNEIAKISADTIRKVIMSLRNRCTKCFEQHGGQFEQFL